MAFLRFVEEELYVTCLYNDIIASTVSWDFVNFWEDPLAMRKPSLLSLVVLTRLSRSLVASSMSFYLCPWHDLCYPQRSPRPRTRRQSLSVRSHRQSSAARRWVQSWRSVVTLTSSTTRGSLEVRTSLSRGMRHCLLWETFTIFVTQTSKITSFAALYDSRSAGNVLLRVRTKEKKLCTIQITIWQF